MSWYRYPDEDEALSALLNNNAVKTLMDTFTTQRAYVAEFSEVRGRNFLVTSNTEPRVYRTFERALRRLKITEKVSLYMEASYSYSARVIGSSGDAAVVISSKCVEDMTDDELTAILGRQLAHIQCGHLAYMQINNMIDPLLQRIPFVGAATAEFAKGLLVSWKQIAEMTADRGGAIASGSADSVVKAMLFQMGGRLDKYRTSFYSMFADDVPHPTDCVLAKTVLQRITANMNLPFGRRRVFNLVHWCHSDGCKSINQHLYYSSSMGTEYFYENSAADDDLRQSLESKDTDTEKFLFLLHSAAGKGSPQAMFILGRSYLNGTDVLNKNYEYGIDYIIRSARNDNADAQFLLSRLYRLGVSGELDKNIQVSEWLIRLAYGNMQPNALDYLRSNPLNVSSISSGALKKLFNDSTPIICAEENEERLRHWLWIPRQDDIAAAEILIDDEQNVEAISVCDTGIYLIRGNPVPYWIDWNSFINGKITATVVNNRISLLFNDRLLWRGEREDSSAIVNVLIAIAKIKEKN